MRGHLSGCGTGTVGNWHCSPGCPSARRDSQAAPSQPSVAGKLTEAERESVRFALSGANSLIQELRLESLIQCIKDQAWADGYNEAVAIQAELRATHAESEPTA